MEEERSRSLQGPCQWYGLCPLRQDSGPGRRREPAPPLQTAPPRDSHAVPLCTTPPPWSGPQPISTLAEERGVSPRNVTPSLRHCPSVTWVSFLVIVHSQVLAEAPARKSYS